MTGNKPDTSGWTNEDWEGYLNKTEGDIDSEEGFSYKDVTELNVDLVSSILGGKIVNIDDVKNNINLDYNNLGKVSFIFHGENIGSIDFKEDNETLIIDFIISGNTTNDTSYSTDDGLFEDETSIHKAQIKSGLNIKGLGGYLIKEFISFIKNEKGNIKYLELDIFNEKILAIFMELRNKNIITDYSYHGSKLFVTI